MDPMEYEQLEEGEIPESESGSGSGGTAKSKAVVPPPPPPQEEAGPSSSGGGVGGDPLRNRGAPVYLPIYSNANEPTNPAVGFTGGPSSETLVPTGGKRSRADFEGSGQSNSQMAVPAGESSASGSGKSVVMEQGESSNSGSNSNSSSKLTTAVADIPTAGESAQSEAGPPKTPPFYSTQLQNERGDASGPPINDPFSLSPSEMLTTTSQAVAPIPTTTMSSQPEVGQHTPFHGLTTMTTNNGQSAPPQPSQAPLQVAGPLPTTPAPHPGNDLNASLLVPGNPPDNASPLERNVADLLHVADAYPDFWDLVVGLFFQETRVNPIEVFGYGYGRIMSDTFVGHVPNLYWQDMKAKGLLSDLDFWQVPDEMRSKVNHVEEWIKETGWQVWGEGLRRFFFPEMCLEYHQYQKMCAFRGERMGLWWRLDGILTKAGWRKPQDGANKPDEEFALIITMPDCPEKEKKLAEWREMCPQYVDASLKSPGFRSYAIHKRHWVEARIQLGKTQVENRLRLRKERREERESRWKEDSKMHPDNNKGAFGKRRSSLRQRGRSRAASRTATPARKEDPNIKVIDDLFGPVATSDNDRNTQSKQQLQRSTSVSSFTAPFTSTDSNASVSDAPAVIQKEPTEVILYGYGSDEAYAAIDKYERISNGIICEDYPRNPPFQYQKFKYAYNADGGMRPRPLTLAEKKKANVYAGGKHWVKVTFESAEAADTAVWYSPQTIQGHSVYAQLYRGIGPEQDAPILEGALPPSLSGSRRHLQSSQSSNLLHTQRPSRGAGLPRSHTTPDMLQTWSRRASMATQIASGVSGSFDEGLMPPSTSASSITATSATATAPDIEYPSLRHRTAPQMESQSTSSTATITQAPNPDMMTHIPTVRRYHLLPAEQALLPQPSFWQRLHQQFPWLFSDPIGDRLPLLDNGEFDWDSASWYWKLMYTLDMVFWFCDVCGLKERPDEFVDFGDEN
ncbi:MAG: hypothetical protein M1834_005374 [Cirrosporium novae-zelandiae]|nr:MAG: hypothetical protein M1834_005374 [Cirrosporium novae-zelandiae]